MRFIYGESKTVPSFELYKKAGIIKPTAFAICTTKECSNYKTPDDGEDVVKDGLLMCDTNSSAWSEPYLVRNPVEINGKSILL